MEFQDSKIFLNPVKKSFLMHLEIKADRAIKDVQSEFSSIYPYLKLEFFKNGAVRRDSYSPHSRLLPSQQLREAWYMQKEEGVLELANNMTVLDLENALIDRFGLSVQVFRRSGNLWLETTVTDHWTLKMQNEHGREITVRISP